MYLWTNSLVSLLLFLFSFFFFKQKTAYELRNRDGSSDVCSSDLRSEWRDRWFAEKGKAVNMDFPGMRNSMGGMDMKKLESLNGNDFDLEFLRQMIAHHEGAVNMAKDAQKIDSHAEIK